MATTAAAAIPIIIVLAPSKFPVPTSDKVEMIRIEDVEEETDTISNATAILWVPGSSVDHLIDVWPKFTSVKWIHAFSAGVDYLKPFITQCLIPMKDRATLTNGRGAFSSSLAEHAIAGMLYFNKQFRRCDENRKRRKWDQFEMDVMTNKTVGLLGYGAIGKATGEKAKAFGCNVIALKRQKNCSDESSIATEAFGYEDRAAFFNQCDFVVCSLPSTPETQQFVGKEEFAMMKQGSVFVSLGRGAVVDEDALFEALQSDHLKGAVLDVFKTEPLPESSPLWDLENVIITPHNADLTAVTAELGLKIWKENLDRFIDGREFATPVGVDRGY